MSMILKLNQMFGKPKLISLDWFLHLLVADLKRNQFICQYWNQTQPKEFPFWETIENILLISWFMYFYFPILIYYTMISNITNNSLKKRIYKSYCLAASAIIRFIRSLAVTFLTYYLIFSQEGTLYICPSISVSLI